MKWLVIADATEKILQTEINQKSLQPGEKAKAEEKTQYNLMAKHILNITKKARSTIKDLDPTVMLPLMITI